jgi:hypothetical protein
MKTFRRWAPGAVLCAIVACGGERGIPAADHVFLDAEIYTADAGRSVAQAIAFRGDTIVFVGNDEVARNYIGERTRVHELAGRVALPGLHDVHLHPEGVVQPGICDLQSQAMSLEELIPFLQGCIERYEIADGEWLIVPQWAFSVGNQPSERVAPASSSGSGLGLRGNFSIGATPALDAVTLGIDCVCRGPPVIIGTQEASRR